MQEKITELEKITIELGKEEGRILFQVPNGACLVVNLDKDYMEKIKKVELE